ncbi:MAG: HAMP domain-containing histidine kinase [Oscillospiraceae bacterium]|nr:HAMP domain-containing histidine kinase [Oscillospiraceae bacterium]
MWMSFMLFATIILVLLWLFQFVFLESYYETMKIRDMSRAAQQISKKADYSGLGVAVRKIAFDNSFSVVVTDSQCNVIVAENTMGSYSILGNDISYNYNRYIYSLRNKLIDSGKSSISVKPTSRDGDDEIQKMMFVTSMDYENKDVLYIFIEASVEPIDATATIIKQQLIYITIILFELAFIITMFLSKRIAQPIASLTATAEEFAKGNYSVKFESSGYSEVKQLSDVLNNAGEEISKVSELRRELVANVSHDLRTPLTIIKSYAEMIRDISGENPKKREEHLEVIINESDRLSNLVNGILELSKLESSERELVPKPFSVHEKLSEVMARYRLLNENEGYNIHFEGDEDAVCVADIQMIDQVLYNLINNAVNYCGDDKEVIVTQKNGEGFVRIEICDHGSGIEEELLPHIFDRYYRAPKAKRDVIGTGLGLSIVKEILKKHGFPFGVSSVLGEGSVFWFEMKMPDGEDSEE